ncbi:hypothetical protein CY34DRAFT_18213 [Suillus luteus UH-Slu-Lm8-n1]|uniref:Uncharacterized protein n=1 Tax=Suillus luteus UH-Slu-Lm8-n1 TaxID=930992 RepID=A0A0C9ZW79_9AGAM|nr:hypothetical protein CY34DRAFT_18213 [Suillus luteus UH-Slu-Lm8-n1]
MHKEIPENEMVKKIAWGIQEPIIQDWYLNDQDHFNKLLFAEYIKEITETDLHKWIDKVKVLNSKHMRNAAQQKKVVEVVALHTAQGKTTGNKKLNLSSHLNAKAGQMLSTTTSTKSFTCLPSLTDEEHQLLCDNDRCFKCHEPFVQHSMLNCSKGFPDGATYKLLTTTSVAAKKVKKNTTTTIAAVDIQDMVAVIMPSMALGNRTDSEECMASFMTPHLTWECLVDSPAVSSSVVISALIDHGSPAVLIDNTLANRLGLCYFVLSKPFPISVALSSVAAARASSPAIAEIKMWLAKPLQMNGLHTQGPGSANLAMACRSSQLAAVIFRFL